MTPPKVGDRVEWLNRDTGDTEARGKVVEAPLRGHVAVQWDCLASKDRVPVDRVVVVPTTSQDRFRWVGRWRTRAEILQWLARSPEWRAATSSIRAGVVTLQHPDGTSMTLHGFVDCPDTP